MDRLKTRNKGEGKQRFLTDLSEKETEGKTHRHVYFNPEIKEDRRLFSPVMGNI